jgi:hypothetical protein
MNIIVYVSRSAMENNRENKNSLVLWGLIEKNDVLLQNKRIFK